MRELQRAFIYTSTLSKQAIEGHVSTAFIAYSVNEGARLTDSKSVRNEMGTWIKMRNIRKMQQCIFYASTSL